MGRTVPETNSAQKLVTDKQSRFILTALLAMLYFWANYLAVI